MLFLKLIELLFEEIEFFDHSAVICLFVINLILQSTILVFQIIKFIP